MRGLLMVGGTRLRMRIRNRIFVKPHLGTSAPRPPWVPVDPIV